MARTIQEILIESDKVENIVNLIPLWNEIANNKYLYPLIQIQFANEHIRMKSLKVKGCDLIKGKFYYELEKQMKSYN